MRGQIRVTAFPACREERVRSSEWLVNGASCKEEAAHIQYCRKYLYPLVVRLVQSMSFLLRFRERSHRRPRGARGPCRSVPGKGTIYWLTFGAVSVCLDERRARDRGRRAGSIDRIVLFVLELERPAVAFPGGPGAPLLASHPRTIL